MMPTSLNKNSTPAYDEAECPHYKKHILLTERRPSSKDTDAENMYAMTFLMRRLSNESEQTKIALMEWK